MIKARGILTAIIVAVFMFGFAQIANAGSVVKEIRHWTGPNTTRIVVDIDGPADFTVNRINSPERMYLDFSGTKLGFGKRFTKSISDGRVGRIRSAQYDKETVRIVMDLSGKTGFKVFSLENPTRVVIDIFKKESDSSVKTIMADKQKPARKTVNKAKPVLIAKQATAKAKASPPRRPEPTNIAKADNKKSVTAPKVAPAPKVKPVAKKPAPKPAPKKVTTVASVAPAPKPQLKVEKKAERKVNKQAAANAKKNSGKLGLRRVVIDPGHGGKDPGAMANGLREKHLVLDIAKRVKRDLEKRGGYEVILTRSTDKFLELEERAMVANRKRADIFVSIHVNASKNKKVRGFETYILNLSNEKKSLEVAARENKVSEREMRRKRDELGVILASMSMNRDTRKSGVLAGKVQKSMVTNLRKKYKRIVDHRDRGAMFYVLYRAQMPSILVEVSYVTNKEESRRLRTSTYRARAAASIAQGIDQYFKDEPSVLKVAMR